MLNKDEDFAEMVSGILVFGYDWFKDTVLAEAEKSTENPNAKADLEAKLAIVESYFKETWNIEFFDNETSGEKGLETYFREAIEKVVSNPPTKIANVRILTSKKTTRYYEKIYQHTHSAGFRGRSYGL